MNGSWTYSILNLRLDIAPVAGGIHPSSKFVPLDLPENPETANAIRAVAFRGLLVPDTQLKFRPTDPVTRGELASAIARSAHMEYATVADVQIRDVEYSSPEGEEITKAVARGFIGIDDKRSFRPSELATADQVVHALRKLALLDRDELEPALKLELDQLESRGDQPALRQTVATLLAHVLGLTSPTRD